MLRARVIGQIWATRKAPGLTGQRLLVLAPRDAEGPSGSLWVAVDTLDARVGDEVLCAFGSGARNVLEPGVRGLPETMSGALGPGAGNRHILCDAAVAQIVDADRRS
jgi:ethanolamine utilization protein EutN